MSCVLCRLNVEEIASALEELDVIEGDVFILPPENPLLSDQDSGDENEPDITHFTGNQLRGAAEVRGKILTDEGIINIDISTQQDIENVNNLVSLPVMPKNNTINMSYSPRPGTSRQSSECLVKHDLGPSHDNFSIQSITKLPSPKFTQPKKQPRVTKENVKVSNNKCQTKKKENKQERSWKEYDIPNKPEREYVRPSWLEKEFDPVQMFETIVDDEVITHIVNSTNLFALQSGNEHFQITNQDMRLFIAILFLSGYCTVPRKRMYWETSEDTHHESVSKAMSRTKFEDILRYIHVCDNSALDQTDKFTKIRPLWNMMNERWLQSHSADVNLSIDESMVPYYGKHSAKQHIHGKPIRFGYKIWCVCTRLGYLIQAEPYQGKLSGNTIPELGVGGSVVVDLLSKLPQNTTYNICTDNFFTSLKLLDYLSSKGHDITGTIRANRVENAPLKDAKEMKKQQRGTLHQVTEEKTGITLVRYNDNSIVTVASTCSGVSPMGTAKRWCRLSKKKINIQQPACVVRYNTYMGGVDQLDQNISTYRIGIRNRKWYWPLISYLLNASMNNAWQLYRLTPKGKEDPKDLLSFTRFVVQTYFRLYTPDRSRVSRPSVTGQKRVLDSVRLSKHQLHILDTNPTQIRCGFCRKNTWKKCRMCQIGCHMKCFENFHK